MKANHKITLLALITALSFSLCACNDETTDDSGSDECTESECGTIDDSDSDECTGSECEEITTDISELTRYQYYAMYPTSSYFGSNASSEGSFTHNGLTWSHSSASMISNDTSENRGLQIGSGSKPVSSGYTLSTDFKETVLLDSVTVCVAANSSGSGTFTITFSDSNIASNVSFSGKTVTEYTYEDLSLIGSLFSFTLKSTNSAVYVKSIGFGVYTTENSSLNLSADTSTAGDGVGAGARSCTATSEEKLTSYYASINDSMSGDALKSALNTLTKPKKTYSYGEARYNLQYTDEVVGKPGYMYSVYDGEEITADWYYGSVWNREHVWPQSRLGESSSLGQSTNDARSDMHNLRVCSTSVNGSKGDSFVGDTTQSGTFYVNQGKGDHRGDVARICFYMYVRYPENGLELISYVNSSSGTTFGLLDTMLSWNIEDPVDDFEKQRNNRIEEYQGNRNPFIDHSEYASRLFA